MNIAQTLLPEFDQEMASTRKLLERVPEDRLDWRPHPKSFTLGQLAAHIPNTLPWGVTTISEGSFSMNSDDPPPPSPEPQTSKELLELFDANVKDARAKIAGADDATMMSDWSMIMDGKTLFTMPRIAVLRSFIMNHIIHHRGQLTVYLRQNDVALPQIYGPTADDTGDW